jgi:hypothetical protein
MDTYLYGLLGLSLAANAFSVISTLVTNSKQRDEENQRNINSIYNELHGRLEREVELLSTKIDNQTTATTSDIRCEMDAMRDEFNESIDGLTRIIDDLSISVLENQHHDSDSFEETPKVSRKNKNRV